MTASNSPIEELDKSPAVSAGIVRELIKLPVNGGSSALVTADLWAIADYIVQREAAAEQRGRNYAFGQVLHYHDMPTHVKNVIRERIVYLQKDDNRHE